MFSLVTKEDTFTPWADKKMQGLPSFSEMLLRVLANAFLEETDPFVPAQPPEMSSGSLRLSAHYMWSFVEALPTMGLYISWTGLFNDNDEEFEDFKNYAHEDYAWSVYSGQTYKKRRRPTEDHWVEKGLDVFDDELNSLLIDLFGEYLVS